MFKIIATLSLILLLVGYFDLKTYYNYFRINISNYINSSEILLASLDNLVLVIFSFFIQLIIWLSLFDHLFDYTEEDIIKHYEEQKNVKQFQDDLTMTRLISSKRVRIFLLILIIPTVTSLILKGFFPNSSFVLEMLLFLALNLWLFMCTYMLLLPITRLLLILAKKQSNYAPKLIVAFVIFLPSLLFTVYIKNQMFIGNRIRKNGNPEKIELITQNEIRIATNDSIRYLGRTESYFLFWNKMNWKARIYPAGQIKEISSFKKR